MSEASPARSRSPSRKSPARATSPSRAKQPARAKSPTRAKASKASPKKSKAASPVDPGPVAGDYGFVALLAILGLVNFFFAKELAN